MKRLRLAPWLLLVLASGCGKDGPTDPQLDASVHILQNAVLFEERTLRVGEQLQLKAELRDADGKVLDRPRIEWSSKNPEVASVDGNGLVVARALGSTQIVASAGTAASAVWINVAEPLSGTPACASGDAGLALAVGQVHLTNAYEATTLCVQGGTLGSEYLYVPFHATNAGASAARLQAEVLGAGISGGSFTPTLSTEPAPQPALAPETGREEHSFHLRLREAALADLTPRMREVQRAGDAPLFSTAAAPPQEGDLLRFNVQTKTGSPCADPVYRTGRVVAVTSRAVVVADTANPTGGFTDQEYRDFGLSFDRTVHPLGTGTFGAPSDVDKNERVVLFYTSAVNDLTQSGSGYYIAGFFYDRDLFPKTGDGACAGSNYAELLYLMVPDAVRGLREPAFRKERVAARTLAVIGHELQHLINASRRLYVSKASVWEETWLNEGLSHVIEELLFYQAAGLAPRSNLDESVTETEPARSALVSYQLDNFERLVSFLGRPDESSPMSGSNLAMRGAAWSFLRYAADRKGGTERDVWYGLANSRTAGLDNLRAVLDTEPVDWMQQWALGMYLDDTGLGGDAVYQQPSWHYRSVVPAAQRLSNGSTTTRYPLRVVDLTAGTQTTLALHSAGTAYLRFGVAAGERGAVRTTSGGLPGPRKLRIALVRIR